MPWISLDDEVGAIRFLLEHPDVAGPVNLTGPAPVTNAEFSRALAQAVGRPAPFAVPAFLVRNLAGAMGEETLLFGQRAVPAKLQAAGYPFRHTTVAEALAAALDRA
jgi:NAD dependent epimerase/dehydratase family enzyme